MVALHPDWMRSGASRRSDPLIAEVESRTSIREVISRRVPLKRAGRLWKGRCPFHGEKTPSFCVYEGHDPHFHCFGCGEHGSVFDFVMRSTGASFPEALAELAADVGISVDSTPIDPEQARAARLAQPHAVLRQPRPEKEKRARKGGYANRLHAGSTPIAGTLAEKYGAVRGLSDLPAELRFHPDVWSHETNSRHPAVIVPCFE